MKFEEVAEQKNSDTDQRFIRRHTRMYMDQNFTKNFAQFCYMILLDNLI